MFDFIPKRYIFSLIGFSATTLAVALITNISLAIVSMVKKTTNVAINTSSLLLNDSSILEHNETFYMIKTTGEFDWSTETQGIIVGCQFAGESLGLLIGGRLAEVYGAKLTMVSTLVGASVLTVLVPVAARWSVYALMAFRVLIGFGTGPVYSNLILLMARWIPQSEQNFTASIVLAGYGSGACVSYLLVGALCASPYFGWPAAFYLSGLCGIIWGVWCLLVLKESPEMHPTISTKELDYIRKNLGPEKRSEVRSVPWGSILTSVPFWALAAGTFGQFWIQSFYTTSISFYLNDVLKMETAENGVLSCIPHFIRATTACIAGVIIDAVAKRKQVSKVFIRKGVTVINTLFACLGFVGIMLSGTNATLNTVFIIIGAFCSDFILFGVCLAPVDMAPSLEGTLSGILAGIGCYPFVVLPILIGYFTRYNNGVEEWRNAFYCSIAVIVTLTLIYLVFGSSDPQTWATGAGDSEEEEKKKKKDPGVQLENNVTIPVQESGHRNGMQEASVKIWTTENKA